ncbi:hypothetical protein AKL15_13950 [Corynebacterium glutamicum]|nr:hypothetical protein AUO96_04705 [Corynebacterium glutamicum]QDX76732.1 hypothetical protein AKL15_13950 [Corynebacterium glutamicum]QDX79509.1 hypothetical protein AKL16_13970 [Corynebacterium glutamicum]TWS36233.1 hypothetical protein AKJ20_02995 [Corynebacterium glutamicum]TWS42459.1 hypothetical protein AKJ24_05125 [Corynebacterium glutamicum]
MPGSKYFSPTPIARPAVASPGLQIFVPAQHEIANSDRKFALIHRDYAKNSFDFQASQAIRDEKLNSNLAASLQD